MAVKRKMKRDGNEKGMIDLAGGEADKRDSSATEEGYGTGKMLPPSQ